MTEYETKSIISEVYNSEKVLIDPHTAVGVGVMKKIMVKGKVVILATAHPSKFSDVVIKATSKKPELPENLKNILNKKEKYEKLSKDIKSIKNYILEKIKLNWCCFFC